MLLGTVRFDQPGLKIFRFVSTKPKQRVQFDRLRLVRHNKAEVPESKPAVKPTVQPPSPRPAGSVRKVAWESEDDWALDRPGYEWLFPFIDHNHDGKIDPAEYELLQRYKAKHGDDWQGNARKELRLKNPE